ncbi:hypothetical protein [Aquimarina litoralis]|uniref:hypothetical protein n=1 Tax=Aquimarina litoralis TaxID=584605 RepID=UPI001C582D17|nr:hypothetical protein [Aquimarina litoralis]MBW1298473.1 hypothetical protein [Aquimarina litoralis]
MKKELQKCINICEDNYEKIIEKLDQFIKNNNWEFPHIFKKLVKHRDIILYHKGDFSVQGNLDLFRSGISGLIVEGNLVVNGKVITYDDPETFLLVTGNLTINSLKNSGMLEVGGDLNANEFIIGDYNHGFVSVHRNAKTPFFYPEEHFFTIHGSIDFNYALGNSYRLNNNQNPEVFKIYKMKLDDALALFHEDVLQLIDPDFFDYKNEGQVQDVEELFDFLNMDDIIKRVAQNKPVFK